MMTKTRSRIITLAKVVVSGALLAYLVRKGSLGAVERAITGASPKWLALGFGFGALGAVLTVWQWWGVLRSLGLSRTYRRCFRLELAGDVFDAALPSSIGGDVLRAVSVAEQPEGRQLGVASVVLRRLCNFPGMVLLMSLGIGVTWAGGHANRAWPAILVALAFGVGLVVVTLSPLAGWLSSCRWLHRRPLLPLAKVLGTVEGFRVRRGALSAAVLRGCLFWCCAVTSQWCYMRAVGVDHVPLAYAGVVVTVTNLVTMLPIAMGGYGLREGTFSALLVAAGMASVAQGVAVGACLTAQTALFGLTGLPSYLTLRSRRRSLGAHGATPEDERPLVPEKGVALPVPSGRANDIGQVVRMGAEVGAVKPLATAEVA
jgi:hypothetical protein